MTEDIAKIEKEVFSDAWSKESLEDTLSKDYNYILTTEAADGTVCGYVIFSVICDDAELLRIAVREDARRNGAGTELMQRMKAEAEKKGASRVLLEVRCGNRPAVSLYQRSGFKEISVRKGYYRNPEEDALIMELTI